MSGLSSFARYPHGIVFVSGRARRRRLIGALALAIALGAVAWLPASPAVAAEALPAWAMTTEVLPNAIDEAARSGEQVEDVTQRDALSSTFANPDGTWTTEVSPVPVHFQVSSGDWVPIDSSLTPTLREGFAAQNRANDFDLLIPGNPGGAPEWLFPNPVSQLEHHWTIALVPPW